MKTIYKAGLILVFAGLSTMGFSQKLPGLDVSPTDLAVLRMNNQDANPIAKITYCRPHRKGRTIFATEGDALVPYGKVWRTGANETAEVIFYKDVKISGTDIKAGTYSVYTIPDEKEWTLILNNKLNTWGAFSYDESKDAYRVTGKSRSYDTMVEDFTIYFAPYKKGETKSTLYMAWENTIVEFPVEF